jgi:hypothetical protein
VWLETTGKRVALARLYLRHRREVRSVHTGERCAVEPDTCLSAYTQARDTAYTQARGETLVCIPRSQVCMKQRYKLA